LATSREEEKKIVPTVVMIFPLSRFQYPWKALTLLVLFPILSMAFTTIELPSLSHPVVSDQSNILCGTLGAADDISTSITPDTNPWTMEDLDDYASKVGVVLSWSTLGPGYRAVARAAHNESLVLGYVEGFVRPSGQILHLDKMEIFQPMIQKARTEQPESLDFGGVGFGLGMLMGYRCLLHGQEQGCSVAEFLAIDDEDFQHRRLVRYYQQAGFKIVKYVGDDFQDIPDRLVWGGCGTLMREDMKILLGKWSRLLVTIKQRAERRRLES